MAYLGTRSLLITVAATEYSAQISECSIVAGDRDGDFITFADAAAGGARQYTLKFKAVQDLQTATLWDQVWTGTGTTVSCVLKPYGNTTASVTQPWYTFSAVVMEPDGDFIGGAADPSVTARMTFECEWPLTAKPVKQTT